MSYVYCDIETDGLNPSTIWVAGVMHNEVKEAICNAKDFREYKESVGDAKWVFHNGIGFDVPAISRIWNVDFRRDSIVDTLVLSRLANPVRSGRHSLRNWGNILGFPKGDHSDWSKLTPEMIDYCFRDLDVTEAVHKRLIKELKGFGEESIKLEHDVEWILAQQQRNGWLLDEAKAYLLLADYKERMSEIEAELQSTFPPIVEERYSDKTGKRLKDRVTVFNLASRPQVAARLSTKGATWKDFTETGKPVVDEKTLKQNAHVPEAAKILEFLTLQKRKGQVASWVKNLNEDTGRVHGRVIGTGAITGRMAHENPNVAQVPSTPECRECWAVPEGRLLVGADASSLELRMLAHYMKDQEFTNVVLEGDIHTRNQMAAGLSTRPQAKTFIYAFLYGAGDGKIGSIVGGTERNGAELKQRFLRNTPALEALRTRVGRAARRGYLQGLDGRRIYVRSAHAALNTLLQGAGAVVMKKALVLLDRDATNMGLDYKFVGNIHDEIQAEVAPKDAEAFGQLAVASIKEAGRCYDLRCALDGEYKIGETWADTH